MPPTHPAPPISAPRCALGQLRGGGRVCYGDGPGVVHGPHCPQARREARERAIWAWVMTIMTMLAFTAMAAAAMASIWSQTCGMGARC